ncbi:MAG: hypothetical protein LBS01_09590 [Prevotellaceae bacterium]|jgi:hypothetical protein|nr:hypothetical protein [Prevotellaceae bacterium]
MKKIFLSICGILFGLVAMGQSELDAVKYVQGDIQGTARYMSMAGAFGALGGDASAIKDNPAGLGIYRGHELGITVNGQIQNSHSDWGGIKSTDNLFRGKLNTFSYVFGTSLDNLRENSKGLLGMNFAFSYNKLKSIDRAVTVRGGEMQARLSNMMADLAWRTGVTDENAIGDYNNTDVNWLAALGYNAYLMNLDNAGWLSYFGYDGVTNMVEDVIPSYSLYEKGYIDEYSLTWSGNFGNRFYLGIGVNLQSMSYDMQSSYSETLSSKKGHFDLTNIYSANGLGFNLSAGGLFKITNALRVSAAVHTPSVLFLTENYFPNIDGVNTQYVGSSDLVIDPNLIVDGNLVIEGVNPQYSGIYSYAVNRPFYANAGLAYIFGKKGLISGEYVFTHYKGASYADENGNKRAFAEENSGFKDMFLNGHTVKVGGEYRVTDNFSVRAGYALQTSMVDGSKADKLMRNNSMRTDAEYFAPKNTNYFTCGVGYQEKGWYIDVAFMHKRAAETFMPFSPFYQSAYDDNNNDFVLVPTPKPADINIVNNNIVATFGLRF